MTTSVPVLVPSRRALVAIWLAAAVGLGALLAAAETSEGPLDDPDPAHQRPGFLDAFGLPQPAPVLGNGLPATGRPTVVFFERGGRVLRLCDALASSELAEMAALAIVVPGPDAVVDGRGRIRYRTLDPVVTEELSEVRTIIEALR